MRVSCFNLMQSVTRLVPNINGKQRIQREALVPKKGRAFEVPDVLPRTL